MSKNSNILLILGCMGLLLSPIHSHASVYKRQDAQGNVYYSDEPIVGGEEIKLPPITSYTPPPIIDPNDSTSLDTQTQEEKSKTKSISVKSYSLNILTPRHNQYFTDDVRTVEVSIALSPNLHEKDTLQLFIDNKPYGPPQSETAFSISNLARGAHTLQVKVYPKGKNNKRNFLKGESNKITVHQRRQTANKNNAPKAQQAPKAPQAPKL